MSDPVVKCELPVATRLARAIGREEAMETLRRVAEDDGQAWERAYDALGAGVRTIREAGSVTLSCVLRLASATRRADDLPLDDAIYWDDGAVVMRGRALPCAVAARLAGRPVGDLIEHPDLEGLVIDHVETGGDGDDRSIVADLLETVRSLDETDRHLRSLDL